MNFYVTVYIDLSHFFVGSGSSQINRFWPALALAPVHCCRYTIFKLFLKTVLIISGSAWIRMDPHSLALEYADPDPGGKN